MKEEAQKFKSIDAEKINITDKDGNVKFTLFNNENIPPAIMNGEDILPGHRQNDNTAGILFYNGEGDECGGLVFGSKAKEDGSYESGLSLTFDQYKQDQVVQMSVSEENGLRHYGISIFDRPDFPLTEYIQRYNQIQTMEEGPEKKNALNMLHENNCRRIFLGKSQNGEVAVRLNDSKGNERIRMVIDANDIPRMEFLDQHGQVIYSLPPT